MGLRGSLHRPVQQVSTAALLSLYVPTVRPARACLLLARMRRPGDVPDGRLIEVDRKQAAALRTALMTRSEPIDLPLHLELRS
jgi:hypothetical protein